MKLATIFTLLSVFAGDLFAAAPGQVTGSYSETKRPDGSTISFYFEKYAGTHDSDTLLVLLQGSDCNSVMVNQFHNAHAAQIWPSADVLMVEKFGITESLPFSGDPERPDCPAAYLQRDTPTQRVRDLKVVVADVLKRRQYRHVIALGGSEGAVVAAMFAAESGVPDAVVLINGGGRWFLEDVLHSIRTTSKESEVKSELEGFRGFAERILNGEPFQVEMSNHGYGWWRDVFSIDLQATLGEIRVPVLVIQGGKDQSVSPDAVREMVESLLESGSSHLDILPYPDLDHGLATKRGQYQGEQVVADVRSWLKTKLLRGPNKANLVPR